MPGILADINVLGHVQRLRQIWESAYWEEVWVNLGWTIHTVADLGLPRDVADTVIWELCQQQQWVLITANRNHEGPDSLEEAIRTQNTPQSLPVFTLADPEQIRHSRAYAERVVAKLLDYFDEIDKYRGAGRLYVP
jgi:hypothetical protein